MLIILHMDRFNIYLLFIVFDIFENHFLSVKKYLLPEVNRANIIIDD